MSAPRRIDQAAKEWLVIRLDGTQPGGFEPHTADGGATRFDLPEATRIQQQRGAEWRIVHYHTMTDPKNHERWLNGAGANWAP